MMLLSAIVNKHFLPEPQRKTFNFPLRKKGPMPYTKLMMECWLPPVLPGTEATGNGRSHSVGRIGRALQGKNMQENLRMNYRENSGSFMVSSCPGAFLLLPGECKDGRESILTATSLQDAHCSCRGWILHFQIPNGLPWTGKLSCCLAKGQILA